MRSAYLEAIVLENQGRCALAPTLAPAKHSHSSQRWPFHHFVSQQNVTQSPRQQATFA